MHKIKLMIIILSSGLNMKENFIIVSKISNGDSKKICQSKLNGGNTLINYYQFITHIASIIIYGRVTEKLFLSNKVSPDKLAEVGKSLRSVSVAIADEGYSHMSKFHSFNRAMMKVLYGNIEINDVLIMYINYIGINVKEGNYDEVATTVDIMLRNSKDYYHDNNEDESRYTVDLLLKSHKIEGEMR